ncbi:CHL1, partial [Hepatospora eriocheir]
MNYFNRELYDVQKSFIKDGIETIKSNEIGIFSSPTGTGKTISLLSVAFNFLNESDDDLFSLICGRSQTKIYYCSRTHSQLNQVLEEFKKASVNFKTVILGSRKVYCINKINKLNFDIEQLNEKCRDLIKNEKCDYYKNSYYSNKTLTVEEMKIEGLKDHFCPYYSSKSKADECELVLLPYNLIFTKEGRDSLQVDLTDKILIVDEAHNIYDAVIQLNTVEIKYNDLKKIIYSKFLNKEIIEIINKLLNMKSDKESCLNIIEFIKKAKLMQYDLLDIDQYLKDNKVAQRNDNTAIFTFSKFLKLLIWSDDKAIVLFDNQRIKFTPLNAKMYFKEINKCKSIIFAGGTMEPTSQFDGLFDKKLNYFSYES